MLFRSVDALTARVVCGGANNQLAGPLTADRLADRGIVYAPDFLVNAGGVIQVSDELHGFDMDRAASRTQASTTTRAQGLFEGSIMAADGTNWNPWTTYTEGLYVGRC